MVNKSATFVPFFSIIQKRNCLRNISSYILLQRRILRQFTKQMSILILIQNYINFGPLVLKDIFSETSIVIEQNHIATKTIF